MNCIKAALFSTLLFFAMAFQAFALNTGPLTTSQIAALHADMLTHPELAPYIEAGDDIALAAYYNAAPVVEFIVWKTTIPPSDYYDAIKWTEIDALTPGKVTIWEWMTNNNSKAINAAKANIRQGISDAFTGLAPITKQNLLTLAKRSATRLEALFATGTGTAQTPGTLTVEGLITYDEISAARAL